MNKVRNFKSMKKNIKALGDVSLINKVKLDNEVINHDIMNKEEAQIISAYLLNIS